MPRYNNAALQEYYDEPEDEDVAPARTAPPTRQTGRLPTYRVAGSGGAMTRADLPAPLPQEFDEEITRPYTRPAPRPPAPRVPPAAERPQARQVYRPTVASGSRARQRPNVAPAPSNNMSLLLWGVGVLLALVASYLLVSFVVNLWQNWQDDMTYGRPRMTRLEAKVGHNETGTNKTLLLAQNIRGQISIIEIPGGDASKTRVIVGPQLFGKDRDLAPVKLEVKDLNADGLPDLVATVQDQHLIYINEKDTFRPINEAERAKLGAINQ
jgi:hypothetical protein